MGSESHATTAGSGSTTAAQVMLGTLPSKLAELLILTSMVAMFFCGMASVTADSRVVYAFLRDGAVPGSRLWHRINPRTGTPTNAIWFAAGGAFLLGLPSLATNAAGAPVACFAIVSAEEAFSWSSFTFAPLAFLVVIDHATLTWWLSARHWFTGPRVQGTPEELQAAERDLQTLPGRRPVTSRGRAGGMSGGATGQSQSVTTTLPSVDVLHQVLDGRLVRPVFQPVVDLEREVPVGYEALARVEVGPLRSPEELFRAGRAAGLLTELDWLCREQAVQGAREAGLRYPLSLFVNAEPETLLASEQEAERWSRFGDLRCYAELTERALAARPAALLRAIDQVRDQDWGIALDDVGADPQSLALLPLVRPDVVKLDLALLQTAAGSAGDRTVAGVLHATLRQAADSGAVIVAEGVETERHLDLARAYGAHYGQGYLLGRPGPLPETLSSPSHAVPLLGRALDRTVPPGPFAVLAGAVGTRRVDPASVVEVARQLLAQACGLDSAAVVLVCANDPDLLPGPLCGLLDTLAHAPVTVAVGSAAALARLPEVRSVVLEPDDPAVQDFAVVVVGSYYRAALVARPSLSSNPAVGLLDIALAFDPDVVDAAGRAILRRLP